MLNAITTRFAVWRIKPMKKHPVSLRICGVASGCAFAIVAILFVSVAASRLATAAEKVIWAHPSPVSLSYATIFAAMELGFFAEEGIEVENIRLKGSGSVYPQIAQKTVFVGYPNPDILIKTTRKGQDPLPVMFVYNHARSSIWEMVVLAESGIKTLEGLKNKQIAVGGLTWGHIPLTKATLADAGLEVGKTVTLVPTGQGAPAYHALTTKQVSAINQFDTVHANLENAGVKIRRIPLPSKFSTLISNGFAVHRDTVKENPGLIARFGRAVTKGILACEVNPALCIRKFWKRFPALKPTEGTEIEKLGKSIHSMRARLLRVLNFPTGQDRRFGEYSKKNWTDFVKALHETGVIKSADVDVEKFYTNQFVDAYNDFDKKTFIAKIADMK